MCDITAENERTGFVICIPANEYPLTVKINTAGVKINIDSLLVVPINEKAQAVDIVGYLVSKSRTDISALR